MGKEHKKKVASIVQMGFTKEQADNALLIYQDDQEQAVEYLLQSNSQEEQSQT